MKIYLAGNFDLGDDINVLADKLVQQGHTVTSSWLKRPGNQRLDEHSDPQFAKKCAKRDLDDIDKSEVFVLLTRGPMGRGGRDVEFGYAWAHFEENTGVGPAWFVILGPRISVFHHLGDVDHVESEEELFEWLYAIEKRKR